MAFMLTIVLILSAIISSMHAQGQGPVAPYSCEINEAGHYQPVACTPNAYYVPGVRIQYYWSTSCTSCGGPIETTTWSSCAYDSSHQEDGGQRAFVDSKCSSANHYAFLCDKLNCYPTSAPSYDPTSNPSHTPSIAPSIAPSEYPTKYPSSGPSMQTLTSTSTNNGDSTTMMNTVYTTNFKFLPNATKTEAEGVSLLDIILISVIGFLLLVILVLVYYHFKNKKIYFAMNQTNDKQQTKQEITAELINDDAMKNSFNTDLNDV